MSTGVFTYTRNLWEETLQDLRAYNLTPEDVLWISVRGKKIPKAEFKSLANFVYDAGFGGQEVQPSLRICGKDWIMYRHEYDGAECWRLISFKEPAEETTPNTLKYDRDEDYD